MRRCGKKKLSFVFIFCSQAFIKERFMRSKRTCFCFSKTVNCQTVTQKNHFWKLSTVNCNAWCELALSKKQESSSCFKKPKPIFPFQ